MFEKILKLLREISRKMLKITTQILTVFDGNFWENFASYEKIFKILSGLLRNFESILMRYQTNPRSGSGHGILAIPIQLHSFQLVCPFLSLSPAIPSQHRDYRNTLYSTPHIFVDNPYFHRNIYRTYKSSTPQTPFEFSYSVESSSIFQLINQLARLGSRMGTTSISQTWGCKFESHSEWYQHAWFFPHNTHSDNCTS